MHISTPLLGVWLGLVLLVSTPLVGASVVCRECSDPQRSKYPGVAFDFTLDYGTSAVYFPNQSAVTIAKIEGSPGYKGMMRSLAAGHLSPNEDCETWLRSYHEIIKSFIPEYMNKVLGRWQPSGMPPINTMLSALQVATETYLDTTLNTTDVVMPMRPSDSLSALLDLELNRLGLRRTLGGFLSAIKAAICADNMPWTWSYPSGPDEPRLILAVDYSRSALTAGLFVDDGGVLEEFRFLQDVDIGADASPSNQSWTDELSLKRRRLLQEITGRPFVDTRYDGFPQTVSELALIGDRAKDSEFLRLLENIVGTPLVEKVCGTAQDTQHGSADPVFTAAKSVAALAKESIDRGEGTCLAWDCNGFWDEWMGL